jgi:sulfite exporter TauE/SafE
MLLAFGFGTMPMLLLAGILSSAVVRNLKNYGNQISGTAMLVLSAILLLRAAAH